MGLNLTDGKIIAILIVVALLMAGSIAYLENQEDDLSAQDITVLSRVNTEGSGIYIKEGYNISDFFELDDKGDIVIGPDGVPIYKPEGWGGMIFGTPGVTSIQHIQLKTIVETILDMNFVMFVDGASLNDDTVYWITNLTNATLITSDKHIDAGIVWEPQFHAVCNTPGWKALAETNTLFPGHTCCVIAGYHPYVVDHESETYRFLAAYIKSVNWLNAALANEGSEDYNTVVNLAMEQTGLSKTVIEEALATVTYTYSDDTDDPLELLRSDITDLVNNLYSIGGQLQHSMSDLGFSSVEEFTDIFVDGSYLKAAEKTSESYTGDKSTVTVAVINGDVHQIAIHLGVSLGYFDEQGISIDLLACKNGGAVAQELQAGNCAFAFLGAPPLTITTINSEAIKV